MDHGFFKIDVPRFQAVRIHRGVRTRTRSFFWAWRQGRWRQRQRRQRRQRQLHWETRRGFPLWLPGDSPPCSCACKWCCYLAPGDENGRHIIQGAVTAAKQHITLWSTQIEHVGNLNGCICVYVFPSETSRTWGCPVQLCNHLRISQDDHSWCHGITGHQWYRISWRMNTCWW